MNKKNLYLLAAVVLLLACAPAFAAEPATPRTGCPNELTSALPWLDLAVCPQAFCFDDDDCRSICPSDPGAFCNLSTGTCTYPSGGGPGGGNCTSNAICRPARFCNDQSDCTSCFGGCAGYCAADGICRLI